DCGIMISASHNPYYDNGIKLLNGNGEKLDENTIAILEDYLDDRLNIFGKRYAEVPYARREKIGKTVDYVSGRNRYIAYLISLGMYSFKGKSIGLDCANGSAFHIARSVFETLGAKVAVINAEPDGFNVNKNAGSTHIDGLCALVKERGLDIGFAYDGDADRCLCVDEKGDVVTGDHILYIYGRYMKERGELSGNKVVTTVMSNLGLYKAFDEVGIEYAKTAVGDRFVYEYMQRNGCRLGGEQSGHIIFSKYATTGDGILTSLKMMEVIMDKKTTLSRLTSPVRLCPQTLVNVKVKDKAKVLADGDVTAAVDSAASSLGESGRILIRASGTEPLIRIMVEAPSQEECKIFADKVVKAISSKGYTE
ncbi:MAG: phosphoglucosamine mutase, partial [Candidatus Coproplasma sp.]